MLDHHDHDWMHGHHDYEKLYAVDTFKFITDQIGYSERL